MIEFDFTAVAPYPDEATRARILHAGPGVSVKGQWEGLHCYGRGHLARMPANGDEVAGMVERFDLSSVCEVTFVRHPMGRDLPRVFLSVGEFDSPEDALAGLVVFARVAKHHGWAINDAGGTAQEILPPDGHASWLGLIFEYQE